MFDRNVAIGEFRLPTVRRLTSKLGFAVGIGILLVLWFASPSLVRAHSDYTVQIGSCPLHVTEGDSYRIRVQSDGGTGRLGFYVRIDPGTAGVHDFLNSGGLYNTPNPADIWLATLEDTKIEGPESFTFAVGRRPASVGATAEQRCTVTIIDDDATRVTDVRVASSPAAGDAYRENEKVRIQVRFDALVRVAKAPTIVLWIGNPDGPAWTPPANSWEWKRAAYTGGSGTDTLEFAYRVESGDFDNDGLIVAPMNSTGMGDGAIKTLATELDADHTNPGLLTDQRVNGRI